MREVTGSALHGTASRLHVDPEEVLEEWPLQVVVYLVMIDHPHQLVDGHDRLTHRLYEAVLSLPNRKRTS